jgi:hypothetical protein
VSEEFACSHAAACREALGPAGRMITASKSGFLRRHPDHAPVFNANLCLEQGRKVWFGDLDLMDDKQRLVHLARRIGETLYVLHEYDGRFANEHPRAPLRRAGGQVGHASQGPADGGREGVEAPRHGSLERTAPIFKNRLSNFVTQTPTELRTCGA